MSFVSDTLGDLQSELGKTRRMLERVRTAPESLLREGWTLKMNGNILWTRPRFEVIREFGIAHMGHHRGQLSMYLRLLDVPLPPIFGPTADERVG